jgi:hypothetical protein
LFKKYNIGVFLSVSGNFGNDKCVLLFVCCSHDVGVWIILREILERWDGVMWSRLVWLRIGTGGELL